MSKVYEYVTERILKELEKGEVPWRKTWDGLPPMNWKSEKHYRGINPFLLPAGEYVTFKQAKDAGGSVGGARPPHYTQRGQERWKTC